MNDSDPRYPIGRFESRDRPLTAAERSDAIDAITSHPERMRAAVAGLSDAQLDTPYREGGWTVRQVVHHVVDSHLNAYVRFKLGVTEDEPTIGTYEESRWAELSDGKRDPVDGSLELLEALHRRWVSFLRSLDPEDFSRAVKHPETGHFTVDQLLELYAWHGPHHEAHITTLRRHREW